MTNNVKFMLLGIFLAMISIGGFVLADEEEFFLIIAIAVQVAAIWIFAKGFIEKEKEQTTAENEDASTELAQTLPVINESQK